MIIDSKKYNKTCACGHTHAMTTKYCIIESGCMAKATEYAKKFGLDGFAAAVYDENTYKATNGSRPAADKEIILVQKELHANNSGVAQLLSEIPENCGYLIAVGSGTIHDLTRYCAHERNIPFISCPTAASVDGFCSSVAAMTWNGYKKTFPSSAPVLVAADLDIISKAPLRLGASGFGDMVGKFVSLAEWKIANILTGEYFCQSIYDMTKNAADAVVESAVGIKNGDKSAYEKLTYGLVLSGLAMQLLGNSRCASGAEHHISHFIEMEPVGLNISSSALHGEKVGVGTLMVSEEYHRIKNTYPLIKKDYTPADSSYIFDMFGDSLSASIIEENKNDAALNITARQIEEKADKIRAVIDEIPTVEALIKMYDVLNAKKTLEDVGVPSELKSAILEYSPLVRNRLTLMRLRRANLER